MDRVLRPEALTASAFAPFGIVIEAADRGPDFLSWKGTRGWKLGFEGGEPLLMLLESPPMALEVDQLEAHSQVTQCFFPAGGSAAVLVVAPPTGQGVPRPEDARAFLLDGTVGYLLSKNTWHSLDRVPLEAAATRWVMVTDVETQLDLARLETGVAKLTRMIELRTEWGFSVRIQPPDSSGTGHAF